MNCRITKLSLILLLFNVLNVIAVAERPNILLLVADDMNYDSPGFAGGVAPDVTPNLDRLVSQSMRFEKAQVAVAVCQPSRQSMLSGRYPHNYGSVGFFPMAENTPTVVTRLRDGGYFTASFNKNGHMLPKSSFPWDLHDGNIALEGREGKKRIGRSPSLFHQATLKTIAAAKAQNAPFFLVINSDDPHRPFHGNDGRLKDSHKMETPSRVYQAHEVTVPEPLPDLPGVREDLANYASSVRRLDDTVGRCLTALDEAGVTDTTIVIFVSDHGMPLPFGKFETYLDSNATPLLIRWPGHIKPRSVNETNLVSLCDLAPTLIDFAEAEKLPNTYGRSLKPLIQKQSDVLWRDTIVSARYEEIYYGHILQRRIITEPELLPKLRKEGWIDRPDHMTPHTMSRAMNKRSINDGRFAYIFNHWYDKTNPKQAYPYGDRTLTAMTEVAESGDKVVADRVEFYTYRSQEEFYDWSEDPGSWHNLIGDDNFKDRILALKEALLKWMQETNDPIRADFQAFLDSQ